MKKITLLLLLVGVSATLAFAESFELIDGSLATNAMTVVKDTAGDHITMVNSTLEVTNSFITTDKAVTGFLRRGSLVVGITNSTITSLAGYIQFKGESASGNTTRVDVVNSTFNATNSYPGHLSLGVYNPNASWKERIFFYATNSTFNLSGFSGMGALEATFDDCRLVFDENVPTGYGFGPGKTSGRDVADVRFRDSYITNWTLRFGDYAGVAPSKVTVDGGTAFFRSVKQSGASPGLLVLTNNVVARIRMPDEWQKTKGNGCHWEFSDANNSTGTVEIVDGASLGVASLSTAAEFVSIRIASSTSSHATWRLRNGTFEDLCNGKITTVYWGYRGSADLYLEEGSLFKAYTVNVGAYPLDGNARSTQRICQTGGLLWMSRMSVENVEASIVLSHRNGNDSRYYLNGGTLKTSRIYGGNGAVVNGGTGYAALSADGGRITPGSNSTKYRLIFNLDLAECGPKGLTVDTDGYSEGAIIDQDFTNKEGERGLFRKTGANALVLRLPGRYDWDVSETRVDGGTLVISNATATMKTTLVVTNGATLSMAGNASTLTLDALNIQNGTLLLDPGDRIVVPASGLSLGEGFTLSFSSALGASSTSEVFVCEGEVPYATLRRLKAAVAASVPAGSFCAVLAETSGGSSSVRVVMALPSSPISSATVWQGADSSWSDGGNWSAGVPSASVRADFPAGEVSRSVTPGDSAIAGALRFAAGGYAVSGGHLRIAGFLGSALIANESGTNEIASAMSFDHVVEVTNAPNTKLVLSGPISGGGLAKTGSGRLELSAANVFAEDVSLSGGRNVVGDADAFGAPGGFSTSVTLGGDTLEISEAVGDGATVSGDFTVSVPSAHKAQAILAATNVTMKALNSTQGAFIKAGPGRLTMLVSGGEKLVAQAVHAKTPYPAKYIVIGEDGVLPDNDDFKEKNDTYFVGVNIYEGELLLRAAPGATLPQINASSAATVIGLHTDAASVTPTLTLDGVKYNASGYTVYANGYNLNNKYSATYTFVPSLFKNRLNVFNGASLACSTFYATYYGGSNGYTQPTVTMTNGTIAASTQFYFAHSAIGYSSHNENALATLNAKDSTLSSPSYVVDGHVATDLDHSVMRAATASGYATLLGEKGAYGKIMFRNGSVFRVGTLDFSSKFKDASTARSFTLAFDDAEWQYGSGTYTLSASILDENHADNLVFRMDGKGVVLKPASGTTFTTELPFRGEGGIVVDGAGTVAFGAGTVQFAGVAEVKSGTLDLSAAGALAGLKVKGPGTLRGATVVDPTIVLDVDDEWGVSSVPTLDSCTISGRVTVDCGHSAESPLAVPMGTPVAVCRFSGPAPDVSGWRLVGTGAKSVRGSFSVSGDTVMMTAEKAGCLLIVR